MLPTSIPIDELYRAAGRAEVVEALREFYQEVDRRIAERFATCWNSGACCRFGAYGHRLYVTTLEAAYYLAADPRFASGAAPAAAPPRGPVLLVPRALPVLARPAEDACPHALDRQCQVRERRPLGCRIFYCDPDAQGWQGPFTEECLEELRRLHFELAVPYFYSDWMRVLRTLASGADAEPPAGS